MAKRRMGIARGLFMDYEASVLGMKSLAIHVLIDDLRRAASSGGSCSTAFAQRTLASMLTLIKAEKGLAMGKRCKRRMYRCATWILDQRFSDGVTTNLVSLHRLNIPTLLTFCFASGTEHQVHRALDLIRHLLPPLNGLVAGYCGPPRAPSFRLFAFCIYARCKIHSGQIEAKDLSKESLHRTIVKLWTTKADPTLVIYVFRSILYYPGWPGLEFRWNRYNPSNQMLLLDEVARDSASWATLITKRFSLSPTAFR